MKGVYPAAARLFRPWKNGGGTTAEILTGPEGAGFDDFTFRLSTARVASSGPFSSFPNVDRVLTVIEGGRLDLVIDAVTHRIAPGSPPLAFPGDVPCMAALTGPPVLDFNVMTRRPLQARVTTGPLDPAARFALLLAPAAGLARLDLIDLSATDPQLAAALTGTPALSVFLPRA